MLLQMPETLVVIPCFNEGERLRLDAFRVFAERWPAGSFLFVDDGSTDNTPRLLHHLRDAMPRSFQFIRLPKNVGKAEAVRAGMQRALVSRAEYVGFWDADLATPLEALPLFEAVLRERTEVEIVLGARVKLLGRRIERNPARHYIGRVFATGVAVVLGLDVYDSQCGAKLFRATDTVRGVFEAPFLSRWIFDVEILARFVALKRRNDRFDERSLYELPLSEWREMDGSKLRARDFVRALVDLHRIWRYSKRDARSSGK